MRSTLLLTVLSTALAVGCSRNFDVGDDTSTDDTSTDDTGDDSDTGEDDSDTDTGGGDTGGPADPDCEATYTTPAPIGGGGDDFCVTDTISCGDTIRATTDGGSTHFTSPMYDTWGCFGPGDDDGDSDYTGAERVYRLFLEGPVIATLRLETPCEDLGLRAIRTATPCRDESIESLTCWRDPDMASTQEFSISLPSGYEYYYDVIVDSQSLPANFKLTVECD